MIISITLSTLYLSTMKPDCEIYSSTIDCIHNAIMIKSKCQNQVRGVILVWSCDTQPCTQEWSIRPNAAACSQVHTSEQTRAESHPQMFQQALHDDDALPQLYSFIHDSDLLVPLSWCTHTLTVRGSCRERDPKWTGTSMKAYYTFFRKTM